MIKSRIVSEEEFGQVLRDTLGQPEYQEFRAVTGPGRSGAVAAVYASHFLRIPFIPYKARMDSVPAILPMLIIDTASLSGKTLRKAGSHYRLVAHKSLALFMEPPRVHFWYERGKPETFRKFKMSS